MVVLVDCTSLLLLGGQSADIGDLGAGFRVLVQVKVVSIINAVVT